jgi:hypothetical protein
LVVVASEESDSGAVITRHVSGAVPRTNTLPGVNANPRCWSLYLTSRSLDLSGTGGARWVTRWKTGPERVRDHTF